MSVIGTASFKAKTFTPKYHIIYNFDFGWGIIRINKKIIVKFLKIATLFHKLCNYLTECEIKQTGENGDIVFWNSTLDPTIYQGYRVATINGQKRNAEDIPTEEIANGIKEILSNQISLPKEDLIREASKLFGFARTGVQVELAMKKGIQMAFQKRFVQEKDGRIVVG